MRLNDSLKIIGEDDILLSDGKQTLSDKLSSIKDDISLLKSNVKWIYNYGGVGSGSGGSGSGGNGKQFTIYATLDGVQLAGLNITLDGIGNHALAIRINNPNGATFNVSYTYYTVNNQGDRIKQSRSQIVSINDSYKVEILLNLNSNDQLVIEATDGESVQLVSCNYITQAYTFNESLIDDNGLKYSASDGVYEIFTSTARNNGVNLKVDYTLSVTADVKYTYSFNGGEEISGSITDKNNSLTFALDKSFFTEENAGLYNVVFNVNLIPEGLEMIQIKKTLRISFIPQLLYALLSPEFGLIYNEEQESDYYIYKSGYISFNYRVYEGVNEGRTYSADIELNGLSIQSLSVTERQLNSFKILANKEGLNILKIRIQRTSVYEKTFYFYVEKDLLNLDWFADPDLWTQYYYRIIDCSKEFLDYKGEINILQSATNNSITIDGLLPPSTSGDSGINTHIAIGLQYYESNISGSTIFNFYNTDKTPVLVIDQETTTRGGTSINYYINQESEPDKTDLNKYHLLLIYSKYIKRIGNNMYYEVSLYIDGILEACFPLLSNLPLITRSMEILPVNCNINCIDIDYCPSSTSDGSCDYDVYQYYLKYCQSISQNLLDEDIALKNIVKDFTVGTNGRITTNYSTINNIAANTNTPVLLFTYLNPDPNDDFILKLEANYGEDGTSAGADLNFPVSILYSKGMSPLNDILFPEGFDTALFKLALQGSSTKLYRVKNFTLSIENADEADEADVYLFSPNFDLNNTETFLPELEFTLKADVVDSSHSNNTSCGKFINTVCRKFSEDILDSSIFKPYIKNCLEGFPTLLFFCIVTTDPLTLAKNETYYYFGVYNFNLGRQSYYNLGYKALSAFGDKTTLQNSGSGFTLFKMSKDENSFREGLGIAEIQGGSTYFDFSQYDSSVLFLKELIGTAVDQTYMFGDIVVGKNITKLLLQDKILDLVKYTTLGGGYLFDYLKKNRGLQTDGYSAEKIVDGVYTDESLNLVPDYTKQYQRLLNSQGDSYFEEKETIRQGLINDLRSLILADTDLNIPAKLNYQSISEYYTICMVLGLVDSVMKNLNIKTWTGTNPNGTTWYSAFYDMDTCLGINNSGNAVNYFAYSDFWNTNTTRTTSDTVSIGSANIYRDFSPASIGLNGFDVPSSYLFAVAKYARLIFPDDEQYTIWYPQELYAKWRSNTINNVTHEGILKDADYFIQNFYSNALGSINHLLISYNYRSKYFSLGDEDGDSIQWVSTDYQKFNGTRTAYVRNWLNGRLHIMDQYLNLNTNMPSSIQYLDGETWKPLVQGSSNVFDLQYTGNYLISQNKDVSILRDIFSSGTSSAGIQISGNVDFKIKCPVFSPLQIYNANKSISYNSICGGDDYVLIKFKTTGVQNVKFGGSQSWLYLSNINFINTGNTPITISSNKLENINGSSGSFGGIQISCRSIKTINLNSPSYVGNLTLSGLESYPNLYSVDISYSKLSLSLNGVNVKKVNVSNIKNSQATISISNCKNIDELNISNSEINLLTITDIQGKIKNIDASTCKALNINMSCVDAGGIFTLNNNTSVESVSLLGFLTINIANCPNIKKIVLSEYKENYITSLKVSNCTNSVLSVTSTSTSTDNTVDLTNLTHTKSVDISNDTSITILKCPNCDGCTIYCPNCTLLLYVDASKALVARALQFYGCTKYTGKTSSGDYTPIVINDSVTAINDMYNGTSVNFAFFRHFINDVVPDNNNITNVSLLFEYCDNLKYTLDDYKVDLANSSLVSTAKLNKVTNCHQWITRSGIRVLYKELISFGGNNVLNNVWFQYLGNCYIEKDAFSLIADKITTISAYSTTFIVINKGQTYGDDDVIPFRDIFQPNGKYFTRLQRLSSIAFKNPLDFTGAFTSQNSLLMEISLCFNNDKNIGYDKLLYELPALKYIYSSFAYRNDNIEAVDLFTIINWEKATANGITLGAGTSYDGVYYNNIAAALCFKKYITKENYNKLCNLFIKNKLSVIDNLFNNTAIISDSTKLIFGEEGLTYSFITKCQYTYYNTTILLSADSEDTEYIDIVDMFANMPNVTSVSHMFQGCKIAKSIPFDFFHKRYNSKATDTIYVKVGDEYKSAKLYEFDYKRDIVHYDYMFCRAIFANEACQFDMSTSFEINRAEDADGNIYSEYYVKQKNSLGVEIYVKKDVATCYEYLDMLNVKTKYVDQVNCGTLLYKNIPIPSAAKENSLIIPPDFFYPISSANTTYCNSCFDIENITVTNKLVGSIPNNIFRNNRLTSISYCFRNQAVLPTLRWEGATERLYSAYPSNYSTDKSFINAFRSANIIIEDDDKVNQNVVILEDTVPNGTTRLQSCFYEFNNGSTPNGGKYRFNLIGKVVDNSVLLGFDMTVFKVLNPIGLVNGYWLANKIRGNIFNDEYDVSTTIATGTIISADWNYYLSVGYDTILPKASGYVWKLFGTSTGTTKPYPRVNKSQILDPETSADWYSKSNILVYN